jgi:taurine dioxygenase
MVDFDVRPVSAAMGAELVGVDLRDLDDSTFAAVEAALWDYEVVFVRGVDLSEAEQLELGHRFGGPMIFPTAALFGATEPSLTTIADGPDSPPEAERWHTDATWLAEPPSYALLQALEVPEFGGDTLWASMTAAYDALSPPMREFAAGLTVIHDNEAFIDGVLRKGGQAAIDSGLPEKLAANYPPVEHPLVRTHPRTGRRALFLGGYFMKRIVGLRPTESDTLLAMLERHATSPQFQARWSWQPGDLAVWDECTTNHRSVADHFPQRRVIRRCEIIGTRPYFDPDASGSPRPFEVVLPDHA